MSWYCLNYIHVYSQPVSYESTSYKIERTLVFFRLKRLIDQETESREKKEQEKEKRVTALKEELTKLKSFALMVVDEQQRLTAQLALQRQKIQDLTTSAKETHAKLALAEARAQEEEQKATRLENELQTQTTKFHQNQETVRAKLTNEDSQNETEA